MSALIKIKLHHFRCYNHAVLDGLSSGLIILSGPNGAGKTNILEAISLLSPGRGLRSARVTEIQKNNTNSPWAVAGTLQDHYGNEIRLGTGRDPLSQNRKRITRINSETVKNQTELGKYLSCIWLTPQMDRLFLGSSRERRKFLDRLIFAFDPGHAGRGTRYENCLLQRSKLLRNGIMDNTWLTGLEQQIAETGIAIAAARLDFIERLHTACIATDETYFPRANFWVNGTIENRLKNIPALEAEETFKTMLAENRAHDAITGGTAKGPHKTDLCVTHAAKNMPADQCSTGEQKALLIGLILAHAQLIKAERKNPPILLLDEIAAHLDDKRRNALYQILGNIGAQSWLTGTEHSLFTELNGKAQFFNIENAEIHGKERNITPLPQRTVKLL